MANQKSEGYYLSLKDTNHNCALPNSPNNSASQINESLELEDSFLKELYVVVISYDAAHPWENTNLSPNQGRNNQPDIPEAPTASGCCPMPGMFDVTSLQLSDTQNKPVINNLPNSYGYLIHRGHLLQLIKEGFLKQAREFLTTKQALVGLGGAGKSELAIRFGHINNKFYQCMYYFNAEKKHILAQKFREFAETLGITTQNYSDEKMLSTEVYKKLKGYSNSLLIFDNVESSSTILNFLPDISSKTHILITSRDMNFVSRLDVGMFTQSEARRFILARFSTDSLLPSEEQIDNLANTLGRLPLALSQAMAKIGITHDIDGYIQAFVKGKRELLGDPQLSDGLESQRATVITTWSMSLDDIKIKYSYAYSILIICAFINADMIPISLLKQWLTRKFEKQNIDNEWLKITGILAQYSMVDFSADGKYVCIHRLVQEVIKIRLVDNKEGTLLLWVKSVGSWAEQLLSLLNLPICQAELSYQQWLNYLIDFIQQSLFDDNGKADDIKKSAHYIPHAERLLEQAYDAKMKSEQIVQLYMKIGAYYWFGCIDFATAKHFFEKAAEVANELKLSEKVLGRIHNNLTYICYRLLDRTQASLDELKRYSELSQKIFFNFDVNIIDDGRALSNLLYGHRLYAVAKKTIPISKESFVCICTVYQKASEELKRVYAKNKDIPVVVSLVSALSSLGSIYFEMIKQGLVERSGEKFKECTDQYDEALSIIDKHFKDEKLTEATILVKYAESYICRNQSDDDIRCAIDLYEKAYKLCREILKDDHFLVQRIARDVMITRTIGSKLMSIKSLNNDKKCFYIIKTFIDSLYILKCELIIAKTCDTNLRISQFGQTNNSIIKMREIYDLFLSFSIIKFSVTLSDRYIDILFNSKDDQINFGLLILKTCAHVAYSTNSNDHQYQNGVSEPKYIPKRSSDPGMPSPVHFDEALLRPRANSSPPIIYIKNLHVQSTSPFINTNEAKVIIENSTISQGVPQESLDRNPNQSNLLEERRMQGQAPQSRHDHLTTAPSVSNLKYLSDMRPSDYEYAQLSSEVYHDNGGTLPEGWEVYPNGLRNDKKSWSEYFNAKSGYFGALYVNRRTKQLVLAHRGTLVSNPASLLIDLQAIVKNQIHSQQWVMCSFIQEAIEIAKKEGCHLSSTGHSLGAWLAELTVFLCHHRYNYKAINAVTFESPGVVPAIDLLRSDNQTGISISYYDLDVVTYFSYPNRINTCNSHVGTLFYLQPATYHDYKWENHDLAAHHMGGLVALFIEAANHLPKCTPMKDWPTGSELKPFFKEGKIENGYLPDVAKLTDEKQFRLIFQAHFFPDSHWVLNKKLYLKHFSLEAQSFLKDFWKKYHQLLQSTEKKHVAEYLHHSLGCSPKVVNILMGFELDSHMEVLTLTADCPCLSVEIFRREIGTELQNMQPTQVHRIVDDSMNANKEIAKMKEELEKVKQGQLQRPETTASLVAANDLDVKVGEYYQSQISLPQGAEIPKGLNNLPPGFFASAPKQPLFAAKGKAVVKMDIINQSAVHVQALKQTATEEKEQEKKMFEQSQTMSLT